MIITTVMNRVAVGGYGYKIDRECCVDIYVMGIKDGDVVCQRHYI